MTQLITNRKMMISMVFLGLSMLGVLSYRRLPVELLPSAELPFLIVQVNTVQATDPAYLESEAIVPLEGAIGTLEGIDRIESRISRRHGVITVFYNQRTRVKYAFLKLREKIAAVQASLPEYYRVQVVQFDTEDFTNQFMNLQVRGGGGLDRVRHIVDRDITRRLEAVDGVASVQVYGGRQKSVEIVLDEQSCQAYELTPGNVASLIRRNGASNTFAGRVFADGRRYFVDVVSEYTDIRDLEDIVVRPDGPVRLRDVAEINFGVKEQTTISRVNGKDIVSIELLREAQVNLIELSHACRRAVARLNEDLAPHDIEIVVEHDAAELMEKNIDLIIRLALIGGALAVVILWLFLRNLRLVLIITLAIPISIYAAFNFFYVAGISVNTLTLVGIALAVGMLLDNSIVVLENIYRLVARGVDTLTAVRQGVGEIWRSVTAATLTTISVFLPFIFSNDFFTRIMGKHIGVSIIATLLVSLAIALLLVPMVTYVFLSHRRRRDSAPFQLLSGDNRTIQIYTVLLKSCLRHPARTIIGTVVVFFVSIIICVSVTVNVTQEAEADNFDLYLTMRGGATLETTEQAVVELEKLLGSLPEKEDLTSRIREGSAVLNIALREDYVKIRNRDFAAIKQDAMNRTGEFRAGSITTERVGAGGRFRGGGGGGGGIAQMFGVGAQRERVVIKGNDFERMERVAKDIDYQLDDLASVSTSRPGISSERPEIHLQFNPLLLSYSGASLAAIASELRSFPPEFSSRVDFKQGGDEYEIVIRQRRPLAEAVVPADSIAVAVDRPDTVAARIADETAVDTLVAAALDTTALVGRIQPAAQADEPRRPQRERERGKTIDDLRELRIPSSRGGTVALRRLSRIVYSHGNPDINRVNQEKQIEVRFEFWPAINESRSTRDAARLEVEQLLGAMTIPPGVAVELVHDENELGEFKFLIGLAFLLIFMILAAVFESVTTPLVMMFTVPLAGIGAFWILILTRTPLMNAYTLTGLLILLGVVVNNGIILIDYCLVLRRRGYSSVRALMIAGRARVRPILITAITTIVAMIPLALGKTEEATIIGAPFAITVIGGLAVGTLFTLIFIPVVFHGLQSTRAWHKRLEWWIKAAMLVALIGGVWLVRTRVDSLLWQGVWYAALLLTIPGLTWFTRTSLRRADAQIVPPDEPIRIEVRNVRKIYDQRSRFLREWNKGNVAREKLRRRIQDGERTALSDQAAGDTRHDSRWRDFESWIWQAPLLGFAVYFVYSYVHSYFWMFALAHVVYFLVLLVLGPVGRGLVRRAQTTGQARWQRLATIGGRLFVWGFPACNLLLFLSRGRAPGGVAFIGLLWYAALIIYSAANRLHRQQIKIARITGRFAGLRKAFYRLVRIIPIIGRKKQPFEALAGVSLEIGSGMLGLLGPNGAGKTTLMRIICGVLQQSYGKVYINGIDTADKREELQGLIGYLPQEFGTYENMTAWEFLNYQAILKGLTDRRRREKMVLYVLTSVNIEQHRDRKIGDFSGGMKQRVGIAQILLALPRILVVDEPTAGLDPRERIRFRNLLVELSRDRVVIFSTHIIEDIYSSCKQVAVLDKGELLYLDEPVKMTSQAEGHAWLFHLSPDEFETARKHLQVVHHMRDGDRIRVRCLAERQPHPAAESVQPTLEDAYLWLLGRGGNEES